MAKVGIGLLLVYVTLAFGALIGWVLNLVHFIHGLGGPLDTAQILRLIGIPVAFVGAVLGWFM